MRTPYRGRLAPSPTGYLHLGHAATFSTAWQRARAAGGSLILRIEDIDTVRCRPEYRAAVAQDLHWLGLDWDEGPDLGGPHAPYVQSERRPHHLAVLERLRAGGFLYPCTCSRREIACSASAPHTEDEEPLYPGTCRHATPPLSGAACHWRFRVPDGEALTFTDGRLGPRHAVAGRDFGDFVVWRRDGVPAYQLAVVADDIAMRITEVVRGEDLLLSTFRQLLLYRALSEPPPAFHHTPLLTDPTTGHRLAKRHPTLNLRHLRETGANPARLRSETTKG